MTTPIETIAHMLSRLEPYWGNTDTRIELRHAGQAIAKETSEIHQKIDALDQDIAHLKSILEIDDGCDDAPAPVEVEPLTDNKVDDNPVYNMNVAGKVYLCQNCLSTFLRVDGVFRFSIKSQSWKQLVEEGYKFHCEQCGLTHDQVCTARYLGEFATKEEALAQSPILLRARYDAITVDSIMFYYCQTAETFVSPASQVA